MAKKSPTFVSAYGGGLIWLVGAIGAVFALRLANMLFDRVFPPELTTRSPRVALRQYQMQNDPLMLWKTAQAAKVLPKPIVR